MSWSCSLNTTAEAAPGALSRSERLKVDGEIKTAEAQAQIEAARIAAKEMIKKGAVGDGVIRVVLTGHSNLGHEQPDRERGEHERAPDRVTVSIERVSRKYDPIV